MIEIESVCVRLGEREFAIRTAGFVRAKPWKKRLLTELQPVFEEIGGATNMSFNSPADLLKMIPLMQSIFLDVTDKMLELLLAYASELEAEREYIEQNATDKQIMAAFQEVVKLSDPFGVVALVTRTYGLTTAGTSSNLVSANGA